MASHGQSSPGPAAGVQVHLLGGFAVEVGDRLVPEGAWRLRKAKTLVKLLALAPGHRLHREQAMQVLWPDRAPAAAANNLHQVLHVARRQLDGGGDAGTLRLRLDDHVLSLCSGEPLWIDAEAFRDGAAAALRSGDPDAARAALELYGGQLLPEDLYEDWTEPTRGELERLREEVAVLADVEEGSKAEADVRQDNLPTELTTFIGREAELGEVARLLRRGPLLTLAGPAGCGKTRLALETAARQRDGYQDGVWLVELAPLSQPDLIPDAVAAAVGVQLGRRSSVEAALVESLAAHEALIVLDNCEHLVGASARLAETLLRGCPGLQVLATSREQLQVTGEIVWRVPSLTLPDPGRASAPEKLMRSESVRLFVDRAGAAQPGFALTDGNADAVAQICHRLDGVPLAIELAAARVGSLPPAEIAGRLGDSFRLLRQERRTAETRQQTLEAALDWSYRLLEAEEATLLRRLPVFAGTFGLDAAEAVCAGDGLPGVDVVDVLVRLVGKSLVVAEETAGQPRFRLLEMVRQYARERLGESTESDALAERHARWYLHLPERVGPAEEAADAARVRLGRLDLETDNLRAALRWLLDHDPPEALRLAGSLSDWWLLRGRLAEGREWLEAAVERTPQDSAAAAAALLRAVPFAARGGDMVRSARLAERSLSIYRKLGDRAGASRALHMLGLQAWLLGAYPRARELLEATIEEAQLAPSPPAEANAAHALGILAISTRDLPGARSWLERALELLEGLPDDSPPAFLVITPGLVPVVRGSGPLLRVVQEESQIVFRRVVGPRTAAAYLRLNLALVARLEGDQAEANLLLGDALARLRAAGDEAGIAQALAATGRLATLEGDTEGAREALLESLVIRRRLGDVRSIGLTLALLAELAVDGGDLEQGDSLLKRALAMFHEAGDRPAVAWMLWALAHVELLAGRTDAARGRLDAGLAVAEELGSRVMRAWTLAALSEVELRAALPDRAQGLLEEACREFDECGDPWGLERCEVLARELPERR